MTAPNFPSLGIAEARRWAQDRVLAITIVALLILTGVLTYLAVSVAASPPSPGGGGVQIQTDVALGATTTVDELLSLPESSLTMLVPLAATLIGAMAAGTEMSSGALLLIAVTARRLRAVFIIRAVVVALLGGCAGALAALSAMAATVIAAAADDSLSHLSVWASAGPVVAGAAAQAALIALIAFGIAALTRRWVIVVIGLLTYLVVIEPLVGGLLRDDAEWLPRTATSDLMRSHAEHVLPTVALAVLLPVAAILMLRRDRSYR